MRKSSKVVIVLVAGFAALTIAASALADGTTATTAGQPTPCITPAGAIYSVNCAGVGGGNGAALGDTTSVPGATGAANVAPSATPSPSPSLTPGSMPSPEATVTPVTTSTGGGSGSNLPDTGAMTAVSSAIGLGAIGYAGRMYWKRRKLANEPVRPMRVQTDPEVLDIAKIGA